MNRFLAFLLAGALLAAGCTPPTSGTPEPARQTTGDGPSARDKDTPGPSSPTPNTPPGRRPAESTGSR